MFKYTIIKRSILVFLGLFTILSANAYSSFDSASGMEIALEGLDFRSNGDFLQYTSISPIIPDPFFTHVMIKKVAPSFHLSFGASVDYRFPCTGNDIKFHWQYLNTEDNEFYRVQEGEILEVPFIINSGLGFELARARVEFIYDAVDLNVGHQVNFSPCLNSRFYAGVRYARFARDFIIRFQEPSTDANPLQSINLTQLLSMKGIGPQVGMDTTYYFLPSFGLEGDISFAGIVENSKARLKAAVVPDGLDDVTFVTQIDPEDQVRVTPTIDARLGLKYLYRTCMGATFKVSAGYQYVTYIGALNGIVLETGAGGGIGSIDFRKLDGNFSGPYVVLAVRI